MSVTVANVVRNHRGLYFEATGDGSTTAITVPHLNGVHNATTAKATVLTAPTKKQPGQSGTGGFLFPDGGTPVAATVTVTSTSVTVTTGSAVGNGTVAYVAVVFDQTTATN